VDDDDTVRVPLNPSGLTRYADVAFPPKIRHKLELLVHIPEEARERSYMGWAAQFEGEEEVGRVTWRFASAEELQRRATHLEEHAGKPIG
jgi:hypothetical protein